MFTVECPGCKASYQIDERRVPASGLRMRCPKCSTAFMVDKPAADAAGNPVMAAGGADGARAIAPNPAPMGGPQKPKAPPRPPPRPVAPRDAEPPPAPPIRPVPVKPATSPTHVEPPRETARGIDEELLPVVAVGRDRQPSQNGESTNRAGAKPFEMAPAKASSDGLYDLDLPATRDPFDNLPACASGRPPARGASLGGTGLESDLPAPQVKAGYDSDSELPAALGSRPLDSKPLNATKAQVVLRPAKAPSSLEKEASPVLDFELDLPSPAMPGVARSATALDDAGLPVLSASRAKQSTEDFTGIDLDLPSPRELSTSPATSTKATPRGRGGDDFELELPSPAQRRTDTAPALPSLRKGSALNRAASERELDLPGLEIGLPSPATSSIGLPTLPTALGANLKTLSGLGNGQTTGESVPPMAASMSIPPSSVPELDLGWGASSSVAPSAFTPLDSGAASVKTGPVGDESRGASQYKPEPRENVSMGAESEAQSRQFDGNQPSVSDVSSSRHGAEFGEVSLETSGESLAVDTEVLSPRASQRSVDGLEFGALPQAPDAALQMSPPVEAAATAAVTIAGAHPTSHVAEKRGSNARRWIGYAAIVAVFASGLSLNLLPDVGPFGAYFIFDQIKRKELDAVLKRHVERGDAILARDDFAEIPGHISLLEATRRKHERLRALSAYGAYFTFAVQLRHGAQPVAHSRAVVALNELGERQGIAYSELAHAARAAVEGNLARARRGVDLILAREPRNPSVITLSAEIALLERRYGDSLQLWQAADKIAPTARTSFGQARAWFAEGNTKAAKAEAERTLTRNAHHVGANLLLAEVSLKVENDPKTAERLIESVMKSSANRSPSDWVSAEVLSGESHLRNSRISLAEAAFQEAISKDPKSPQALRGLGETLFRAGRYSESLARFEAAIQADPESTEAAIGAGKTQLSLERIREAIDLFTRLRQANPKNFAVVYWYARACEAGGNRDEAEKAYAVAIDLGGSDPSVVDAYVGLALVKSQQGRSDEAQKVLEQAQQRLPNLPKIHEAVGQLALSEGRYVAASEQFLLALSLEPNNIAYKFKLGTAYRKNRQFEEAGKAFDEVAAVDRDFPGLALERGQLFESSGQTEEALRAFESALAKAPNDPDLMLRVGCGKVSALRPEQAEQLLKKVLEQRPMSAETHHCLGRAQLLEGTNLALALRTLQRAVDLDPHRAEYHLYVGWAANEAGNVALAEQSLKRALELDQGLGDAYWQRGILRYRQGAIKDSVSDLTRALALRPGRYEAHAALADAYFDLGLEEKALEQWGLATQAQPDNATWAFRYGKLLQTTHHDATARVELEKAIGLAEKSATKPRWIWEAHHLLARALGSQPGAVKHWQAFLELAPRDNVYRDEAKQTLLRLGQPWDKD